MAQPPKINDQKHQIRVMFGNGLRPQIWRQFKERFGIKLIGEFYAATEGNANLSMKANYHSFISIKLIEYHSNQQ